METFNVTKENQALQLVASKDETRPNLTGVYFNCKHAVATNGHILAIRPKAEGEPDNKIVRFDSPKQKGKLGVTTYQELPDYRVANSVNGDRAEIERDSQFPDYKQVLNEHYDDSNSFEIAFNASYLLAIAQALTASKKDPLIRLRIPKDQCGPIYVTAEKSDGLGVLMPVRIDSKTSDPLATLKRFL